MLKRSAAKIQGYCIIFFFISETGSKCNSPFRPIDSTWVIIIEPERKVEYSWACTFWAT